MARGWAAFDKRTGEIDLRTVGPTIRSAQVNWLWLNGVNLTNDWTDERIALAFDTARILVEVVEVEITLAVAAPTPET